MVDDILDSFDQALVGDQMRSAWQMGRDIQGNYGCDIVECERVGSDAAAGISGTLSVTTVWANLSCLRSEIGVAEIETSGGVLQSKDSRIIFYDANPPLHYSIYMTTLGEPGYWDILTSDYQYHTGRCTVDTRHRPEAL